MKDSPPQTVPAAVVGPGKRLHPRQIFLNENRQLRNGWWIGIFMLILAAMLFPLTFYVQQSHGEIELWQQACITIVAAFVFQRLRGKALSEMMGAFNKRWALQFLQGGLIGSTMMLLPAFILVLGGWVELQSAGTSLAAIANGLLACFYVAIAEEILFRGVFLQRLSAGLGAVIAQIIVAAYFWLTHSQNPGMNGVVSLMAGINIFLASIMFGLAYYRTHGLAMPLGLHLMANFVQGTILGFGVSGHQESGLLAPQFLSGPVWLTGGSFGLEASLPGLLSVVIVIGCFGRCIRSAERNNSAGKVAQ